MKTRKVLAGPKRMALARVSVMRGESLVLSSMLVMTALSGRKIIEILKKNPKKDPSKYDEDDLAHMRKVVAYLKRHLAQEEKAKQDPESKSAKSLKNWGHNPESA